MKKICFVTTISLTIKSFFIPQLKYLAENGYDVTVICSPCDDLQAELGSSVRFIPIAISRGISYKTIIRSIKDLIVCFKKEKFDIVQYSTPNAAFCASIAAKIAGIKIRNYHLMGLRYLGMSGLSKQIFRILETFTCRLSTHIECITPSNLELAVSDKLFRREKAVIVGSGSTGGVDLTRFSPENKQINRVRMRNELGICETDFVFGFVGRITGDKGINELLEAFLGIENEKCRLLIIGNDERANTVDSALWDRALCDERVIIHSAAPDIEKYYSAIDVLVLPSYREGFGMVIAEAAAMGIPAIVSDIPGPTDVIENGKTAFTVEVKNAKDLREKMLYFLDDNSDYEDMSAECVKYISDNFYSVTLNEKILKRKDSLIALL